MEFLIAHSQELVIKLIQQIYLVSIAVFIAMLVGIPLGILAARYQRLRIYVLSFSGILQTIPSLALLAFLLPFLGIGAKPAIIALALYALLPVVQNTVTGLTNIPSDCLEAADSIGFTPHQRLWLIELPLALPFIIAGIRTATIISVAIATLAAFIGAGGLGDFINRGLALNSTPYLLLGAIPAAILALLLDYLIRKIEFRLRRRVSSPKKRPWLILFTSMIILTTSVSTYIINFNNNTHDTIKIASKNFTEQFIISEIMAQLIEAKTSLHVERKFNLGTTDIAQQALATGQIDLYPEYTGTAYLTVLHLSYTGADATTVYNTVKQQYLKKYNIVWLAPLGFSNTQALAIRSRFAQQHHIKTITDLVPYAKQLIMGAPTEFIQRPDGMPGLQRAYGLHFKAIKELASSVTYEAIQNHQVDAILAFSTDGRLPAYHLTVLQDDKHLFPPYDCVPLIRAATLHAHPELIPLLSALANNIDTNTMQQMNYAVDEQKRSIKEVAHEFLVKKKLTSN